MISVESTTTTQQVADEGLKRINHLQTNSVLIASSNELNISESWAEMADVRD